MILFRFLAYEPGGAKRGNLPFVTDWSFGSPFDDKSSLTFSYSDGMAGYEHLLTPCEVAIETSNDGGVTWREERNARFLRIQRGWSSGAQRVRKYTMPSFAFSFQKTFLNRSDEVDEDGKYTYAAATAGGILADVISMNQPVWNPNMTYNFTGLVDSAGAAWALKYTIAYEPGTSLWTILNNLVDRGAIDWYLQGRELRVFNAETTMAVTQPVSIQRSDLDKLDVDGDLTDLAHQIMIFGDKDTEDSSVSDTATTPLYWGRWVTTLSASGDDIQAALANARAELINTAREQVQYAATLNLKTTTYTPLYSFQPGDYVQMDDENGTAQTFRVRAVNYTRKGGDVGCTLIINDRFVESGIKAARRLNNIVAGAPVKGGTANTSIKPQSGKVTPSKAGPITSAVATAYINGSGYSRARIEISFPAVTTGVLAIKKNKTKNVTGQKMRRYEFRGQVNDGTTHWEDWGSKDDATSTKFQNGLNAATAYIFQYAAVSEDGIQGAWSDTFGVTTPQDVDPPPKPATPTVTTRLGQLIVDWNGLAAAGGGMGRDFDRVEIRIVGQTDAVGVLRNGKAPYVVPNVTIGTSYVVFLRPFDRQGNVGTDSDNAAAVAVKGVMDDPQSALQINQAITVKTNDKNENTYSSSAPGQTLGGAAGDLWFVMNGGQVTAQYVWTGTGWQQQTLTNSVIANLDAGKITTGTLAAARIAANTITADMINAGAIDATKLSATAIDGKTISAPVINGGTITGSAFQTAVPGAANRTVIGFDGRFYAFGYNQATAATEMMWDFKPYAASESTASKWGYCKFYMPVWAADGLIAYRVSNKDEDGTPMFGQELGLLGYTTDYGGSSIYLTADDNTGARGRIYSISIYARTYTSSANMYITSSYTLGRSTSASKYKINIDNLAEELTMVDAAGEVVADSTGEPIVHYRDVLSLEPKVWYDKGTAEHYASSLANGGEETNADIPRLEAIPGLIAEDVYAALGPEFVEFAADGETIEGIMYDRAWITLIPIIRSLRDRLEALEAK